MLIELGTGLIIGAVVGLLLVGVITTVDTIKNLHTTTTLKRRLRKEREVWKRCFGDDMISHEDRDTFAKLSHEDRVQWADARQTIRRITND